MNRFVVALVASTLALALVPPGAAQAEGTLFLTDTVVSEVAAPDCQRVTDYGMAPTVPAGAAETPVYLPIGIVALGCPHNFVWTATQPVTLGSALRLVFPVACDIPAPIVGVEGSTTQLRFILFVDGVEIGRLNWAAIDQCGAPFLLDANIPTGGASIPAGGILNMRVINFIASDGANAHTLTMGGDEPARLIGPGLPFFGPVTPPAPDVIFQDITKPDLAVAFDFEEATSATYVYNWTNGYTDLDVTTMSAVANGTVAFDLRGADGASLLSASFTGNLTETEMLEGVEPGNYTLEVEFTDFVGGFEITITETQMESGPSGSTGGSGGSSGGGSSSGGSGKGTDGDGADGDGQSSVADSAGAEEESPGLALVAIVALLAFLVWRRR